MSATPPVDNPLDCAIRQLSDISSDRELLTSAIDAGMVRRMLVHMSNINVSVLGSTRDHANASKRLNDFALSLDRMARKSEQPNEALRARVTSVVTHLRVASEELAHANAVPNWRTRASLH